MMSDYIPAGPARSDEMNRTFLAHQDGVTCWMERVPPGECGSLRRDTGPSITVVLAGGPVELIDESDRVLCRTMLSVGRVVRGGELPLPYRPANLADRDLVLVVIELSIGTTTFGAASSHSTDWRAGGGRL
ncbi:hypothetical protein [Nocardia crassostreae]|uniref:hypothetical protein n=1 Tax=Nocardia crassostreae TaxID=53428 RepID=UPI00082D51DD|nr:hypothetical protein [Nocardia crassostreae]